VREREKVCALLRELDAQPVFMFPKLGDSIEAPESQGVYLILRRGGRVVHVGRTHRAKLGLAQRLRNHLRGNSSFTKAYLAGDGGKLRGRFRYKYLEVDRPRTRALLEAAATGWYCPRHLGVGDELREKS